MKLVILLSYSSVVTHLPNDFKFPIRLNGVFKKAIFATYTLSSSIPLPMRRPQLQPDYDLPNESNFLPLFKGI
jgi:hypothetical protein